MAKKGPVWFATCFSRPHYISGLNPDLKDYKRHFLDKPKFYVHGRVWRLRFKSRIPLWLFNRIEKFHMRQTQEWYGDDAARWLYSYTPSQREAELKGSSKR